MHTVTVGQEIEQKLIRLFALVRVVFVLVLNDVPWFDFDRLHSQNAQAGLFLRD